MPDPTFFADWMFTALQKPSAQLSACGAAATVKAREQFRLPTPNVGTATVPAAAAIKYSIGITNPSSGRRQSTKVLFAKAR